MPLEVGYVADSRTALRLSRGLELVRWRSPKIWGSVAALPLVVIARHIFDLLTGERPTGSALLGMVGVYVAVLVLAIIVVAGITVIRMMKVNPLIRSYAAAGNTLWARYGEEAMEVPSATGFTTIAYSQIKDVMVVAGAVIVRRNAGADVALPRELVPESAATLLRPDLRLADRGPRARIIATAVVAVIAISIGVGMTPALEGPLVFAVGTIVIPVIGFGLITVGLVRRRRDGNPASSDGHATSRTTGSTPEIRIPLYRRSAALMVAGAVLMASGLLGIGLSEALGNGVSVGDCVSASDFHKDRIAGLHPTSCGDPDAVYELAARVRAGHSCPDGELANSVYFVLTEGLQTLCFAPDVIVGACYLVPDGQNAKYEITPADCGDRMSPGTLMRATGQFDSVADKDRCSMGPSVLPRPPRVVCWTNQVRAR